MGSPLHPSLAPSPCHCALLRALPRMVAAPHQKFEAGVAKISALRTMAVATTDLVNEAWSALRTGVVVARKLEELLDSRPPEEIRSVLEFMLQRANQKKAAREQVKECLRILLVREPWLAEARAEQSLRDGVREVLDSEQDAELVAQLDTVEEQEVEEEPAEEVAAEAAEIEDQAQSEDVAPVVKPLTICERLVRGRVVLKRFGWEFPCDPTGTSGDEATAGFMSIFDAVTALTTTSGKASVGNEPMAALACLEQDWASLLQFLVSMYTSGVRNTCSSRIRFVVVHLRALAPAFRELAPWASLPWGHLPMPAEEAEAEARALEEFKRQQAEEAESLRLAQELQAEEDAQVLALQKARSQRVQEDFALACKLEAEAATRPERAPRRQLSVRRLRLRQSTTAGGA